MKKKLFIACISILTATTGLASCAKIKNQINLTPEESRNLRIASSLGTLNHLEDIRKEKAINSNLTLESELENVLYSVEVLLVNDFHIETTNKAEGDFEKFGVHYSNHEQISFISTKDKVESLNIYYNDLKSENDLDIKYEENIDGIVTSYYKVDKNPDIETELKIINFNSTSLEKEADVGKYLERKLTLYHKNSENSLFEISEFKSDDIHQFYYEYRALDKQILSYSIDLNQDDDISMMFSVLGYRLKFLRIEEDDQVAYKVGVINGDEYVQILRFTKKVSDDGTVTYHLEIDI